MVDMNISYKIKSLDEVSFSVNFNNMNNGISPEKVIFRMGHNIVAKKDSNEIEISIHVFIIDSSRDVELVQEGVRAIFNVKPFEKIVLNSDENGIEVSEPLLIDTFINVTIGAVRGLLVKNLKGTPLNGFVLPLISMTTIRENITGKKKE